jgi:hypothetical protein
MLLQKRPQHCSCLQKKTLHGLFRDRIGVGKLTR